MINALIACLLLTMLVTGLWLVTSHHPPMMGLGLMLSAGAPLLFIARQHWSAGCERRHPVMVSVLSGFGCVMIMVGIQRFGEQHQWVLGLAVVSLIAWMAWQRWVWRQCGRPSQN